jgi:hypothetical protein
VTLAEAGSRSLALPPEDWPNPPEMSTLHAILLFVGVPALIFVVITLLVLAPSLARGPRYRPGQDWDAQPEWLSGGEIEPPATPGNRQLTAGEATDIEPEQGGASARW